MKSHEDSAAAERLDEVCDGRAEMIAKANILALLSREELLALRDLYKGIEFERTSDVVGIILADIQKYPWVVVKWRLDYVALRAKLANLDSASQAALVELIEEKKT